MKTEKVNKKIVFTAPDVKKIFWVLAVYSFWVILFFIVLDIAIGGILFYKYVILSDNNLLSDKGSAVFNYDSYNKLVEKWQNIEKTPQAPIESNSKNTK